ncbi:ABC transporter substrate-binding protein [Streptomyces sp. NPDC060022]|uniref:ABC transporter substrate-binding protein n=1 Tax=Streptomyces sp. NPDC060022 TaxID=3347039 RepID=UPI00369BF374
MSTSRRVFVAAMATTLAVSLSACGGFGSSSTVDSTLKITANITDRAAMKAVVEAFERENPNAKVAVTYTDTDRLQSTLPTQLSSDAGPDVFTVWPGYGNPAALRMLEATGRLADLSDLDFVRRVPEDTQWVTQVSHRTYVVPANYSGIGAIYNKKSMGDIDGTEPETWDELLHLCDKAKAEGMVLFALGIKTPWVTQLADYALAATTVYAEQPDFAVAMSEGRTTFADSGWRKALEKYVELDERGCFSSDPLGTTYERSVQDVVEGRAVGVIQVASSISTITAAAPELQLAMFALPATNNPAQTHMPGSVSAAYGVNPESDNKELAMKFAEFLGSEAGQNSYNQGSGTLPAIPNDRFTTEPVLTELIEHQKAGTTVPFMDQLWPNPRVQQEHFIQIQELFSGRTDIDGVLAALDEVYQEQ